MIGRRSGVRGPPIDANDHERNPCSGLTSVAAVKFECVDAASFSSGHGADTISAITPPGTGIVDVTVTNEEGTINAPTQADHYTYVSAQRYPARTRAGPHKGGTTVTVTVAGTSFVVTSAAVAPASRAADAIGVPISCSPADSPRPPQCRNLPRDVDYVFRLCARPRRSQWRLCAATPGTPTVPAPSGAAQPRH